jgi:hypothetical protein
MVEEKIKYDCFYGFAGELPVTDERLPKFQKQMMEDGWDNTQLWSFDYTLAKFCKDKLEWIWKQSPETKPEDSKLFKGMKLLNGDSLFSEKDQKLANYFWQWLESTVLKEDSDISEYKQLRNDFFEFLKPRLIQFTKNSKNCLVKDGTYDEYFRVLDNTIEFVIPVSLDEFGAKYRINEKRYFKMLSAFVKNIGGLWI